MRISEIARALHEAQASYGDVDVLAFTAIGEAAKSQSAITRTVGHLGNDGVVILYTPRPLAREGNHAGS